MSAAATLSSEVADLQDVPLSDLDDSVIKETIARILLITPAPAAAFQSAI